ncbi:MAG: glycosyltransferase family 2 protein [Bryobacteraceae bacterium]
MKSNKTVTVVIPCRNEKKYIEPLLESLLAQDLTGIECEVLISEGMSDDGTREAIAKFVPRFRGGPYRELRVVDNPEKIVAPGLNRAIRQAWGEYIIRLDAHSRYAPDYLRQSVEALEATGAWNTGGPTITEAKGYTQEAIALAFHSPFGSGGARFHDTAYEGWVDTVMFGCWRKDKLIELGLFDEELVRNQDDELNLRIQRAGGKIFQTPKIRFWYSPRSTLKGLWKQYYQYGYWKVRVLRKHHIPASWRHLVPGSFVGAVGLFGILALLSLAVPALAMSRWMLAAVVGTYVAASMAATVAVCAKPARWKYIPIMPFVFAAFQFSYGLGFLRGLFDLSTNREAASTLSTLSR